MNETKLAVKKFKPAIELQYRWRDWAAQTETAAELDALLPAILDKTFKGEL